MSDPAPVFDRFARRVVRLAILLTMITAAFMALARGGRAAATLTLSAAAGIVLFRTLQLQVRLFLSPLLRQHAGWRALLVSLRMATLGVVTVAAVHLGSKQFLALIVGFAVVPAALLVHGIVQASASARLRPSEHRISNHGS